MTSNKENWYCHDTCEHEHEYSQRHKSQSSGPNGCVSDELACATEMNCLQSRARARVVLKEIVSSAEMIGHKADPMLAERKR